MSSYAICAAVVLNLTAYQTSMVGQDCPPDVVVEKLALPVPAVVKPLEKPVIKILKPDMPRCRKGEKMWRTLKSGKRKYRIRRTC